jgi:hypothetical protein
MAESIDTVCEGIGVDPKTGAWFCDLVVEGTPHVRLNRGDTLTIVDDRIVVRSASSGEADAAGGGG